MVLTPQQRRTLKARESFLAQFKSDEARREHMAEIARRSAEQRIVLSSDEVEALGAAYRLLDSIYLRHQVKLDRASEDGDGDDAG